MSIRFRFPAHIRLIDGGGDEGGSNDGGDGGEPRSFTQEQVDQIVEKLHQFHQSGYQVWLDDFGSGYNSFHYLRELTFDYVKIDGSFVREIEHSASDLAMVRSINEIAHALGLDPWRVRVRAPFRPGSRSPVEWPVGNSTWKGTRMPTISTNDLKNGTVLDLDGQLWQVIWFQHHKPGKGNTVVRSKLKHVLSGKVVDKTFNSDTKVESAQVDRREMQYLYNDGDSYVFMDTTSYEQVSIPSDTVGDAADYMLENQNAMVALHDENPLYIELPASVELEITYTEPGLQGDRSSAGTKPATLETGKQIQVPLFIEAGTKVKVDTRDGSYLGRING